MGGALFTLFTRQMRLWQPLARVALERADGSWKLSKVVEGKM